MSVNCYFRALRMRALQGLSLVALLLLTSCLKFKGNGGGYTGEEIKDDRGNNSSLLVPRCVDIGTNTELNIFTQANGLYRIEVRQSVAGPFTSFSDIALNNSGTEINLGRANTSLELIVDKPAEGETEVSASLSINSGRLDIDDLEMRCSNISLLPN